MARAAKSDDRYAERLKRQRQAVAEEFGIADIGDWRVKRLALLQAAHASAEDRMAAGGMVDIAPLLALDSAIQDIRQALKADEPCNITVQYVQSIVGICPECKARIPDYRRPDPPPVPPPTPPAPAPIAAVEKPASAAVKPDKASPQVTRVGVSASAFHSQVVNGVAAPLKKDQSDIYAIRSISPMSKG